MGRRYGSLARARVHIMLCSLVVGLLTSTTDF